MLSPRQQANTPSTIQELAKRNLQEEAKRHVDAVRETPLEHVDAVRETLLERFRRLDIAQTGTIGRHGFQAVLKRAGFAQSVIEEAMQGSERMIDYTEVLTQAFATAEMSALPEEAGEQPTCSELGPSSSMDGLGVAARAARPGDVSSSSSASSEVPDIDDNMMLYNMFDPFEVNNGYSSDEELRRINGGGSTSSSPMIPNASGMTANTSVSEFWQDTTATRSPLCESALQLELSSMRKRLQLEEQEQDDDLDDPP